tara:strand:+ start:272 stop:460 length:189 start_codon:yes stop_codon:yes gene_type:complete
MQLYIIEKLSNILKQRKEHLQTQITNGIVEDFIAFKELRGRFAEIEYLQQELKDLQKKVEHE